MKNEVLLYFPGSTFIGSIGSLYPPLAVLPIGNVLEGHGYKARIIDARLENFKGVDPEEALYVGISSMTGRQIKKGLEIAKWVREKNPEVPIVWGGVHPSLLPDQTLGDPLVDVVVRGEGERPCLELAECFERETSLEGIRGIAYREDEKVRQNPDSPFLDLDEETSDIDYTLIKRYEKEYEPEKTFHYTSSRGCPHRCQFCYNTKFCNNVWRTKSLPKIEAELQEIMDRYHPKRINFLEDNFFVKKKRVEEICRGMVREGYDVEWTADVRANYFKQYDAPFMRLLRKSGCRELIIGAESGSQRLLDMIQKDITVDQTRTAVKKCLQNDIGVFGIFMIGFPTETKGDVETTMGLIDELTQMDKERVSTTIAIFAPYPGTQLYDRVVRDFGFHPPESLKAWGDWNFIYIANSPWFDWKYREYLEVVSNVARVKSAKFEVSRNPVYLAKNLLRSPFVASGQWRWRHRYFEFPIEWKIWTLLQKRRGYA